MILKNTAQSAHLQSKMTSGQYLDAINPKPTVAIETMPKKGNPLTRKEAHPESSAAKRGAAAKEKR